MYRSRDRSLARFRGPISCCGRSLRDICRRTRSRPTSSSPGWNWGEQVARLTSWQLTAGACRVLQHQTEIGCRRVVIIVDEAHLLDPARLEELRLLTNSEMDSASPFAAILAGQPTLN